MATVVYRMNAKHDARFKFRISVNVGWALLPVQEATGATGKSAHPTHCCDATLHRSGVLSLLLVACFWSSVQSQQTVPVTNQILRPSLQSLFNVNGRETCVMLGNALNGRTNGLEGMVCCENVEGNSYDVGGYIRWHVVFRRIDGLPFPRDEQLRLSFLAKYTGYEPEVIHQIELRQGATESRSSFLAPSYGRANTNYYWRQIFCRVYSDGRELRGLRALHNGSYNNAQQSVNPQAKNQSVLIASKRSIDEIPYLPTEEHRQLQMLESKNRWLLMPLHRGLLNNMPTDWREIATRNSYAIDADELPLLTTAQSAALRQYIASGGQLIIADCQTGVSGNNPPYHVNEWLKPFVSSASKDSESWLTRAVVKDKEKGRFLDIGFGRVVLCEHTLDEFTSPPSPQSIFNPIPRLDRLFEADMMNWMIPKLGQPPVLMFCLSIGAFAVMAGPGLLWWTNFKTRRPVWLLMLFPLFAVLITSSIFAYALLHDGFGTSGRIRSMTWIDAESGFGCAYSRQTYFSGFPPAAATFTNASEVWEMQSPEENRRPTYASEPVSEVELHTTDEKQLFRGLLTAREQKQWIVTTPVSGLKPFEWTKSVDGQGPRVRNRLHEAWQLAIFVDQDKQLYAVDQVTAELVTEPRSITLDDARKLLNDAIVKPNYPVGYFENESQSLFDWFSNRSNYRNTVSGGVVNLLQSIESMIESWPRDELTKPNRFVLLLERADHLDRPFKANVTETDSSHIMIGTW